MDEEGDTFQFFFFGNTTALLRGFPFYKTINPWKVTKCSELFLPGD